eukprot:COSAG02_NODE_20040_length_851_cov_0.703457_1_plen_100_part_10
MYWSKYELCNFGQTHMHQPWRPGEADAGAEASEVVPLRFLGGWGSAPDLGRSAVCRGPTECGSAAWGAAERGRSCGSSSVRRLTRQRGVRRKVVDPRKYG